MKFFIVFAFAAFAINAADAALSGSAQTSSYWDCCKPSCSWQENVESDTPVTSCSADGVTSVIPSIGSACDFGSAYICNNLQPWAVNDTFAYGFVAASFSGDIDNNYCCVCLTLKFNEVLEGKTMIVQNVNTRSDLSLDHFDIQIPGGGVGIFPEGCQSQWNFSSISWGEQNSFTTLSEFECDDLPVELRAGCQFRFTWFQNADNPQVTFDQVECPSALTSLTNCVNNNFEL
ncbi:hypothetical protein ABEB36_004417 [Hypothenemus hampei]|uniref:cellulase n=1 Tax=Hypothenemus hampei TaxID=57062 RepID=A0ABD1F3V7_HYPHA